MIQQPPHAAQPLYSEDDRRVGTLAKDMRKTISFRTGLLLKPEQSISNERAHLDAAIRAGVSIVIVTDSDTGNRYSAPIERILSMGFRRNHPAPQVALPLRLWDQL